MSTLNKNGNNLSELFKRSMTIKNTSSSKRKSSYSLSSHKNNRNNRNTRNTRNTRNNRNNRNTRNTRNNGIRNVNAYYNTIKYRTLPLKTKFIKADCNIDHENIVKILSDGKTQTESKVYLIRDNHDKHRKLYIIKETPYFKKIFVEVYKDDPESLIQYIQLPSILSEGKIYNQVVNTLINENITPYIIMGHGIQQCDEQNKIFLINETGNDNAIKILKLKEFLEEYNDKIHYEVLLHILFQIVYTLKCFDIIKLQHNDLHIDNILVFIRRQNIFNTPIEKLNSLYYFKYGKLPSEEFLLLNLGIDIRIYDFDQAFKQKANTQFNNLNIEIFPENEPYTKKIITDIKYKFIKNTDLFKVLGDIYSKLNDFNKHPNILQCLFYLQHYLNTEKINKVIGRPETDLAIFNNNFESSSKILNRKLLFLNGTCKYNEKTITLFSGTRFTDSIDNDTDFNDLIAFIISKPKSKPKSKLEYFSASELFKSPEEYFQDIIALLKDTHLYKAKGLNKLFFEVERPNIIDSFNLTSMIP